MPCTDGGESWATEFRALEKRNDKLAKMLCALLKAIEPPDGHSTCVYIDNVPHLRNWWTEHKRIDSERVKTELKRQRRERYKQSGLAKLSDAEIIALGLKDKHNDR